MAPSQREQAAQLLVLLRQYVMSNIRQFPFLLQSVPALREGARAFGRNDLQQATQKGVEVYENLMRARAATPGLPLP